MKHHLSQLPNGMRVATTEMADAYSATVSVFIGVGSRYEDFATNGGVSHFLEHMLFKGTKKRPSAKIISEQVDAVGGYINAYTSNELTNFYVKVPHQHLEMGIELLSDMLLNSLFDETEISRERDVILEEMNVYRDDPASYVHRLTLPLLWPGHPLEQEVIGSEKAVKALKRPALIKYLQTFYRPGNMVVAAAGKINHEQVVGLAKRYFGDMNDQAVPEAVPFEGQLSQDRVNKLQKDTAQVHLVISTLAYPYKHPNDATAKVLTTILGRGVSSRLFTHVREEKGLAYSVNAGLENFVDTGEFEVYAGVNTSKTTDAIAAIIEELRKIIDQPVTKDELQKGKNQIRGSLQMAMESNTVVADRLGSQLSLLGEIRTVEQTLAEIDAVTAADIQRVAAEMLAPDRLRLGIISPDPEPAAAAFVKLTEKEN